MSGHPDQFFGGRTFSQHGEDLMILNIFWLLGIARPSYLDIGAHHPTNISNTALLYARGSRGINVEANPSLMPAFFRERVEDTNVNVGVGPEKGMKTFYMIDEFSGRNTFDPEEAHRFVRENPQFRISRTKLIQVMTLNAMVAEFCPRGEFPDLLTIDVEGLDLPILQSTDFSHSRPKVICVEIRHSTAVEVRWALERFDYFQFCRMGSNGIFIQKQFVGALE